MDTVIKVLHIDDSPADRGLVFDALMADCVGFALDQGATMQETREALAGNEYDIVLSDFNILGFQGLDVIDLVHKKSSDIPVIIVTGTGSEKIAVEAMKRGAVDYVIKTPDHIRRLPLTIQTAIERSRMRQVYDKSQVKLARSQARYETLFNDSPVPLWEEDFTELYSYLNELKSRGIDDLRDYFETNPYELSICASKVRILNVNKAAIFLHGADNKAHLIESLEDTFTEESFLVFGEEVLALASGKMEFQAEVQVRTLKGEVRCVFLSLTMYQGEAGSYKALLATTDITELKSAEKDREQLKSAMEATRESVVVTNSEGTIQYVNPAFERVTGYSREEAIGQNPRILKSGKHADVFYLKMWKTLVEGNTWSGRVINRHKNGSLFTEEVSISPVLNPQGKTVSYVGVKHDISSEILLEAQLRQAQKMESIGLLAGGVAHDFNNMLAVIVGNADLALLELDHNHPVYAMLKGIRSAADRSADLTNQLLAFARKQTIMPVVLDLNDAVEGILKMMRRLIGEDIDLAWLPGYGVPLVKMDPSQIDQVLANLCVNARDAIGGVGKVTVETSFMVFDKEYCADHPGFIPGNFVMLAVSDTGEGMTNEILDRIFEPFFSTKDQGEGTGLGLATVYGIVKQNGGFINAYSELGVGSTFKIYLPQEVNTSVEAAKTVSNEPVAGGNETILVVEDEPAILELTLKILKGKGYTVVGVADPIGALKLVQDKPGKIDLLVTDVILPNMSGGDLVKELVGLLPGMKHMYMSGYTANMIADHGVLDEGVAFLQKPFSKRELEVMVREVLDLGS